MGTEIDLRGDDAERRREQIRRGLTDLDVGDRVTVLADDEPDLALSQFEITHDVPLTWEADGVDSWSVRVTDRATDGNSRPAFDVRDLPPQERHAILTETFELLDPGQGFVLVNDHDPKPLYHELRSSWGDIVGWEYHSKASDEWRVEIAKTGEADTDEGTEQSVTATFDVRQIPKRERHPTIHHRYGNLADGETMEIIAPHEPRPLKREFRQRYGESFSWTVVEHEQGRCRVRITKGTEQPSTQDSENAEPPSRPPTKDLTVTAELDVRDLPPAQRHEQIFEAYAELESKEAFVLVNDHDPKPLYHQFEAEAGDEFRWEYQQQQPGEFRVLVGKEPTADSETEPSSSTKEDPEAPF